MSVNSYAASTDVHTVGTWVVSLLPSELCQCGSHNPSDAACVTFGAEASGRRTAAARRFCAVVERASLTGWGISSRVFFFVLFTFHGSTYRKRCGGGGGNERSCRFLNIVFRP